MLRLGMVDRTAEALKVLVAFSIGFGVVVALVVAWPIAFFGAWIDGGLSQEEQRRSFQRIGASTVCHVVYGHEFAYDGRCIHCAYQVPPLQR